MPRPTYPALSLPRGIHSERWLRSRSPEFQERIATRKKPSPKSFLAESTTGISNFRGDSKEGASESFFADYLTVFFRGMVFKQIGVYSVELDSVLVPDFLIYDYNSNLHISIEIDEPYTLSAKEPIHYVSETCLKEGRFTGYAYMDGYDWLNKSNAPENFQNSISRTSQITKWHWIEVRFSESQIVKHPVECCVYLSELLTFLTEENFFETEFIANFEFTENMWTRSESIEMAFLNYRGQYLHLINSVSVPVVTPSFNEYSKAKKLSPYTPELDDDLPY